MSWRGVPSGLVTTMNKRRHRSIRIPRAVYERVLDKLRAR